MYRKTITRKPPAGAKPAGPGKIRIPLNGRWVEKRINEAGQIVEKSSTWYGKVNENGKPREYALQTSDKKKAAEKLEQLKRRAWNVANGLEDLPQPNESMPLVDLARQYIAEMESEGLENTHIETVRGRLSKILESCGFEYITDLKTKECSGRIADGFQKIQKKFGNFALPKGEEFTPKEVSIILGIKAGTVSKIARNREVKGTGNGKARRFTRAEVEVLAGHKIRGLAPNTMKGYRASFRAFLRWLMNERELITRVPLLPKLNKKSGGKIKTRRAITWEECQRLISSVRAEEKRRGGLQSTSRALLYLVAFQTLLRRRALQELTPADCHLEGPEPCLSIRAETCKTGKTRTIPVTPAVALELAELIKGKPLREPIWNLPLDVARILRADLRAAGIPFTTEQGQFVFHSFRHSGATHLARMRVGLDIIITIGGWVDPKQFFETYGHFDISTLTNACRGAW